MCTIPQIGYHIPWPLLISYGPLAGMKNKSMGPLAVIDPIPHKQMLYQ